MIMAETKRDVTIQVKASDQATPTLEKIRGSLEELRKTFGRGSVFKELVEVSAGGGAIAGLTMAARAFADFGDKTRQAIMQYRLGDFGKGPQAVEALTDKLIEAVPILGDFYKASHGIA